MTDCDSAIRSIGMFVWPESSSRRWKQAAVRLHLLRKDKICLQGLDLRLVCLVPVHPHLEVFVCAHVFQCGVPATL